jgi:hypothetical protein
MSEGPVNFGKPLFFLVLIGCIGGGYYYYTHATVGYEGHDGASTYSVDFPHGWEVTPGTDPAMPTKVIAKGPLGKEEIPGVAWMAIFQHGTLDWPNFPIRCVGGSVDPNPEDTEIAHKRALVFQFEDAAGTRWQGAAVQRGDALVICCIGCAKASFAENQPMLDKCIRSIRCAR